MLPAQDTGEELPCSFEGLSSRLPACRTDRAKPQALWAYASSPHTHFCCSSSRAPALPEQALLLHISALLPSCPSGRATSSGQQTALCFQILLQGLLPGAVFPTALHLPLCFLGCPLRRQGQDTRPPHPGTRPLTSSHPS